MVALPLRGEIPTDQPGLVSREFIYESAPFPECHASTIVETPQGLLCAWFGGLEEKDPSVGIWTARREGKSWSAPVEVATGVQPDGMRLPCWNPVLWQEPGGPLLLFYKVGPSPSTWWGMLKRSDDGGRTWGEAVRLPDGILGPIKNKPVRMPDGTLVCPSSSESNDGTNQWRVHFELTRDLGATWTRIIPPAALPGEPPVNAIQPSILLHPDPQGQAPSAGTRNPILQALGRSRSGKVIETWSRDGGRTWSPVALTALPNPSSGTDAVTLRDGRHLLVYNPVPKGRSPLSVALSADGKTWKDVLVLENEPGEYSYPAIIQAGDGTVHVTYTWKRVRLRHVVVDPKDLR
jgi:predicted neuraminidase